MDREQIANKNKIMELLEVNSNKNFVKRILNRDDYPVLANPDKTVSTHSMSWGEANGKYYVYPTVIQIDNGMLQRLDDDTAWDHAMKTGEFIELNTPEEADSLSKNYKEVWK